MLTGLFDSGNGCITFKDASHHVDNSKHEKYDFKIQNTWNGKNNTCMCVAYILVGCMLVASFTVTIGVLWKLQYIQEDLNRHELVLQHLLRNAKKDFNFAKMDDLENFNTLGADKLKAAMHDYNEVGGKMWGFMDQTAPERRNINQQVGEDNLMVCDCLFF